MSMTIVTDETSGHHGEGRPSCAGMEFCAATERAGVADPLRCTEASQWVNVQDNAMSGTRCAGAAHQSQMSLRDEGSAFYASGEAPLFDETINRGDDGERQNR